MSVHVPTHALGEDERHGGLGQNGGLEYEVSPHILRNSAFWGFCSTLLSSEHSGLREKDQTAGCGRPRVSSPSSACLTACCWSLVHMALDFRMGEYANVPS